MQRTNINEEVTVWLPPLHRLFYIVCADVTEPNSSDSRGERLDFFLKQEEALTAEPSFISANESEEHGGGGGAGTITSVANLKAALMSKNSLLSLRAEMMGDDNPLLYEYLPKGGHSLSWLRSNNCSSTLRPEATGATFLNKQGAGSSPPPPPPPPSPPLLFSLHPPTSPSSSSSHLPPTPPTPLLPSEPRPLEAPGPWAGVSLLLRTDRVDIDVEDRPHDDPESSNSPELLTLSCLTFHMNVFFYFIYILTSQEASLSISGW
uniref:probable inactive serine/threonine-protein kinase slob2 isoform X3 n=1 Tax=Solea senegalensis TaxID=28829 RepID=UPI001CD8BAD4|nr:probable inactive serine/threonine-protein kinase slob2 isoform X3 [Solea senegalensis]